MICTLDHNDFCQRHQMRHWGHLRQLALDPTDRGERYRMLWDGIRILPAVAIANGEPVRKESCCRVAEKKEAKPPSLLQQAKNYMADLAAHKANSSLEVPPEVRAERRAKCEACEYRDAEKDMCNLCGCPLHQTMLGDKLAWAISKCPDGRWDSWKPPPPDPVRHLLFHLWPRKLSLGTWQRNLDQLKTRWGLFNGRKIIAVATSTDSHDLATVQAYMQGYDCEWIHVENDPALREVKTFLPLFEPLARDHNSPNDFIFYAQGKGVTKAVTSQVSIHPWTSMMYEVLLDYWPLIGEKLKTHPVAGAFKKNDYGFKGSRSDWHYSGSFCWFRASELFSRKWRSIERVWFGIESYPSMIFSRNEAGCVFYERNGQFNLYSMRSIQRVEEELRAWRSKHSMHRSSTGSLMAS